MYSAGPTADSAKSWPPLIVQAMVNELGLTTTGSLNLTVTFLSTATSLALFAGSVRTTVGAVSGGTGSSSPGFGGPAVKSAALLSVSTVPPPARRAAVVLLSTGAAASSKSLAAP